MLIWDSDINGITNSENIYIWACHAQVALGHSFPYPLHIWLYISFLFTTLPLLFTEINVVTHHSLIQTRNVRLIVSYIYSNPSFYHNLLLELIVFYVVIPRSIIKQNVEAAINSWEDQSRQIIFLRIQNCGRASLTAFSHDREVQGMLLCVPSLFFLISRPLCSFFLTLYPRVVLLLQSHSKKT